MRFPELARKYDVPAPRYTSYPTVPAWEQAPDRATWLGSVQRALAAGRGWSLYIHIPFCETLCTFCGCNTSITRNHEVEQPYVDQVLAEWATYLRAVPGLAQAPLRNLHLGGGTPTFLSEASLRRLLEPILGAACRDAGFEGSVEVDPRRTSPGQLAVLRELGFDRVSLGVQDIDPEVQRVIHRVQPLEQTLAITRSARELGYASVNWDLIYGLPLQTLERMTRTVEATLQARPDRIALYSFALVPWIKPAQRIFRDEDLPVGEAKRALYERARSLLDGTYREIGMDHFALPTDGLSEALDLGTLHRNFMGYVGMRTDLLLGLGVSAISETPEHFHQNEKVLNRYAARAVAGEVPTHRGHCLTAEDRCVREQILQLMTRWSVDLAGDPHAPEVRAALAEMVADGLVALEGTRVRVLQAGRPFLRNACMALDRRLVQRQPGAKVFSQAL